MIVLVDSNDSLDLPCKSVTKMNAFVTWSNVAMHCVRIKFIVIALDSNQRKIVVLSLKCCVCLCIVFDAVEWPVFGKSEKFHQTKTIN